ncbi:MAG: molybdate ABC transporter substrate-binding protein [Clostridiales bacterium]|nr:molybdate ABC transporter substrate-binding protein [Clostridiales bacterium]
MKKRIVSIILAAMLGSAMLAGCGSFSTDSTDDAADDVSVSAEAETEEADADEELSAEEEEEAVVDQFEETTITIYAAASLQTVLTELIDVYNETQPNVTIVGSYDSSGTLLTQIEEANGDGIDIFFSAAQKQMNTLEEDDGLVVDGTRHNVVNNQVCVITYTGSETTVTGLADIANASSLALADGSVPVGKYTRQALVNAGMLDEVEDVSTITTDEVSAALGGIEINECGNVSKVLQAVAEQSNEVGTVYYSDTYGYEDQVEILEYVSYDLTGNVIYPVAQVANGSADELESAAAADFIEFLISDEAKAVFDSYYFDTDVED